MDLATRKAYDAARVMKSNSFDAACYAPFVSMYFTTSGNVVACCRSQSLSVGNVVHERLDDIWNGSRIADFRRSMKAYALPSECAFCSWQISSGDHAGVFARNFDGYGADESKLQWPKVMEFAISNECNLECVMCTGESSSRIRARREHLPPLPDLYGETFFADLRKYLPHIQLAKFLGGEPFMSRGNFRIWDMMIEDRLATPCIITTNGTIYDAKVERVLEHLPVSINFSIDGATKKTLESIRVGARHEVLLKNARRFIDYTMRRGTTFDFLFSLMRENWREVGEFLLMSDAMGIRTNISTVVYPPQYSLFTLPTAELRAVLEELERQDAQLSSKLSENLPVWKAILASVRGNATEAQAVAAARIPDESGDLTYGTDGEHDHFVRATVCEREGRREEAIVEAMKSTPRQPSHYFALVLAGRLQRYTGRFEQASTQVARAVSIAPARPEAYVERAWLRRRELRFAEGIADIKRAHGLLATCPSQELEHELCGLAASLFAACGRLDEARLAAARVFELRPDAALSYALRGWAWHAAGRTVEALKDARAALARDPDCQLAISLERAALADLDLAGAPVRGGG